MNAYKVEILIIDHDRLGKKEIEAVLRNANFPNDCLNLHVKRIVERDIGEWSDGHVLNYNNEAAEQEYKRLFGE